MIKHGNTSFQEEAIKKMSFKQFKATYSNILKGEELEKVYEQLTGSKVEQRKNKPPLRDTSTYIENGNARRN